MSRIGFLVSATTFALGTLVVGGMSSAHAQQAGAVDPSYYNTAGPGVVNETRPTLVLPQRANVAAAANPADGAKLAGWSPVGGPYVSASGQALASNQLPGDAPTSQVAGK